ncbi:hypothetical protein D4R71_05615 [bacterium]|nr:MAG: hypothetical protein D4R71_05615 [bacterium]
MMNRSLNLKGEKMKAKKILSIVVTILFVTLFTLPLWANNVQVSTVTITDQNTTEHYSHLTFDISWDNSWRLDGVAAPNNWDAAWVFAKWKLTSGTDWAHCTLNTSGHTAPTGSVVENPSSDNPQTGVFIYRSEDNKTTAGNAASVEWNNAKLRWNYGIDEVADDAIVDVKVFAIEMVYITEGAFYVGDTDNSLTNCFYEGSTTHEFQITSENEITVANTSGNLYYDQGYSNWGGDQSGPIPADFPKGYQAFYCMKYEISQGQYVDFLNTLTSTQDGNRSIQGETDYTTYRGTICGYAGIHIATRPDRACNYLSWADDAAYSDWAGLRPMTELEFEKICRGGTLNAVNDEYAWGTTYVKAAKIISGTEDGTETITTAGANCCCSYTIFTGGDGGRGPLRCGIFATSGSSREQSGASYYGVMEMSGSVYERPVTLGNSTGRAFTGTNGDGVLASNGDANVSTWPGINASGAGSRGGGWADSPGGLNVAYRFSAAKPDAIRDKYNGFRSARTQ